MRWVDGIASSAFLVAVCVAATSLTLLFGSTITGPVNWELVVAVAAGSAAGYQWFISHRFAKIDRAYSHSVYKSDRYLDALDELIKLFPSIEDKSSNPFDPKIVWSTLEKHDKNRRKINIVLNHWGRFASEYYAGILDRDRARETLHPQFSKVFEFFGPYFHSNSPTSNLPILDPVRYANTLKLMDEWQNIGVRDTANTTNEPAPGVAND